MIVALLSIAIFQVQELPHGFGAWRSVRPSQPVSREWAGRLQEALRAVKSLAADSTANRRKKLQEWMKRCQKDSPTAPDAYRAAHYYLAFPGDCREAGVESVFIAACASTRGATDAEFLRMAYSCLGIAADPLKWPGMGPRLLAIFKDDPVLKKAFVNDCAIGFTSYEECQQGLALVPDIGLSIAKSTAANAQIRCRMYELKKKKSDLDLAITLFEKAIALETDARKKEVGRSWLADLKKKRDQGKFVSS